MPHQLDYQSPRYKPRDSRWIRRGILAGIIAIAISSTFGVGEGKEGYARYLYPFVLPFIERVLGLSSLGWEGFLSSIIIILYWPIVGLTIQVIVDRLNQQNSKKK